MAWNDGNSSGGKQSFGEILGGLVAWLKADALAWCEGRSWLARLPLWIFLAYVGARQFADPMFWSLFGPINLGVHEGGHLLFRAFGEFLCVAGGTILQLVFPLGITFGFLKQRDYFGIAVCLGWLSTNFYSIGVYMSDAMVMQLDLVTVGDNGGIVTHDWRFLLSSLGLLSQCKTLGWLTCQLGNMSMLLSLAFGGWLMWQMFSAARSQGASKSGRPTQL